MGQGHPALADNSRSLLGSYTIVYDYNDTPSDRTDDVKIGRPTIVRDVGNKDDVCEIVVGAIG